MEHTSTEDHRTCPPGTRPRSGHPAAAAMPSHPATHRAREPRFTPAPPPVPRDPAAPGHQWADRWPLRSYLELAALDTAPGSARAHVGAVLWEWDLSAVTDETALIVSELLTNAVHVTQRHRRPDPVRLWMLGTPGTSALIIVWDATRPAPARRAAAPDAEHGRGLEIVEALATRWGHYHPDSHPGGKCVWALVTPEPATPAHPAPHTPTTRCA